MAAPKRLSLYLLLSIFFLMSSCNRANIPIEVNTSNSTVTKVDHSSTLTSTSLPHKTPTQKSISATKGIIGTQIPSTLPTEYQPLIGMKIPPMPECCVIKGSSQIEGQQKYAIDLVLENSTLVIWSTILGAATGDEVVDILILPELGKADTISANGCQINGRNDPYVIAISKLDREAVIQRFVTNDKIRQAWRVNPATGKIEELSTAGIECSVEGGFDPNNVIYEFLR